MLKDFAILITGALRDHGHQAYLVGGCVRDLLLGREPADYDVTTDAKPDQVMRLFSETYAVGAQFGVVLVPLPKKNGGDPARPVSSPEPDAGRRVSTEHPGVVEVATFRSDIGYSDGRHPDQVRYSRDPREDIERRDFTINGLLMNPINQEVIDFVGGRKDLEFRTIRAIGEPERRFTED